ncbi:hypothetical protein PTKIN_Ptkin06aG0043300 [Pterospermum kingtungense]
MSNRNPNPNVYILVDQESDEGTEPEPEPELELEPESEEDSDETQQQEEEEEEEEEEQEEFIPVTESLTKGAKGGEGSICSSAGESGENPQGNEWNRGDIDGLFCPICMEAWTTSGDHHICCLPCGHIYGLSCIRKWLQLRGASRKCPQCNRECTFEDVRRLFASRLVAIDGESQKRIQSLEAKCISLEKKSAVSRKKEAEWRKREDVLRQELLQLKESWDEEQSQGGSSSRPPRPTSRGNLSLPERMTIMEENMKRMEETMAAKFGSLQQQFHRFTSYQVESNNILNQMISACAIQLGVDLSHLHMPSYTPPPPPPPEDHEENESVDLEEEEEDED